MASEGRLRTLIDTIPDLIWLKDPEGVYLSCNHSFERFFGVREAELLGRTDQDFPDARLSDFCGANDRAAIAVDGPRCDEEWITFADDGRRALLRTTRAPMYDPDGTLVGVLGIGHDITEHKQKEDALRESEEKYRLLFDSADELMSVYDRECVCRLMNRKVARLLGGEPEQFVGKRLHELHPGLGDKYCQRIREVIDTGQTLEYEDEVSFPMGRRWLFSRVQPVPGRGGVYTTAQIVSQEMTERRRADAALQEQLDELRRWHDATLEREGRVLELKREVNALLVELGRPPRYLSVVADTERRSDHD